MKTPANAALLLLVASCGVFIPVSTNDYTTTATTEAKVITTVPSSTATSGTTPSAGTTKPSTVQVITTVPSSTATSGMTPSAGTTKPSTVQATVTTSNHSSPAPTTTPSNDTSAPVSVTTDNKTSELLNSTGAVSGNASTGGPQNSSSEASTPKDLPKGLNMTKPTNEPKIMMISKATTLPPPPRKKAPLPTLFFRRGARRSRRPLRSLKRGRRRSQSQIRSSCGSCSPSWASPWPPSSSCSNSSARTSTTTWTPSTTAQRTRLSKAALKARRTASCCWGSEHPGPERMQPQDQDNGRKEEKVSSWPMESVDGRKDGRRRLLTPG